MGSASRKELLIAVAKNCIRKRLKEKQEGEIPGYVNTNDDTVLNVINVYTPPTELPVVHKATDVLFEERV